MIRNIFSRRWLNHSLYEWLNLISNLFVPLVIGILTIVVPLHQETLKEYNHQNSYLITFDNRLRNIESLHDEQKHSLLNNYQRDLTSLIDKYDWRNHSIHYNERISFVIRIKTLHVLRQLDPAKKIVVLQLLFDSGIQHRINISHVDLSSLVFPQRSNYNQLQFVDILARNISLENVNLYRSNFSYSILDNSIFLHSNCSYTDFSYASLQRTIWTNTDVTQARFNYTNLYGANITQEQLAKVQSLQGAILPNGSFVPIRN